MSRRFLFAIWMTFVVTTVFAQTAARLDPGSEEQVARGQELMNSQVQNTLHDMERGERQAWINSMANLSKLRLKLAEAWQVMGMSSQGAKAVADAYDPGLAAGIHHEPLHGKSDEQVAAMLQDAIRQKHYLSADQLLIDYQRDKLRMGESASPK